MKDQIEVQIVWRFIEFLEDLIELFWDHYADDFEEDNPREENLRREESWTE